MKRLLLDTLKTVRLASVRNSYMEGVREMRTTLRPWMNAVKSVEFVQSSHAHQTHQPFVLLGVRTLVPGVPMAAIAMVRDGGLLIFSTCKNSMPQSAA